VDRRDFLLTSLAGALAAPLAAEAQQTRGARRIGLVGPREEPRFSEIRDALKEGLREQGYAEPSIETMAGPTPRGNPAGARAVIESLIRQRPEVLFVIGSVLAKVARQATPDLPIMFITPGDPVAAGVVASLARPARNMTAITFEYPELSGKRLELLRELVPGVKRVLVLYDPSDASPRQGVEVARAAASRLGLTLSERHVRAPDDVRRGLAALRTRDKISVPDDWSSPAGAELESGPLISHRALSDADALLGVPGGVTTGHYVAMIEAAHANKRPTVFHTRTESTAAALMTYGANEADVDHRPAEDP
jgi:putative ABC transport system substrate-binding protein